MQSILIPISIRFNTNTENDFKFILSRIKSKISVIKVKADVKEMSHMHAICSHAFSLLHVSDGIYSEYTLPALGVVTLGNISKVKYKQCRKMNNQSKTVSYSFTIQSE